LLEQPSIASILDSKDEIKNLQNVNYLIKNKATSFNDADYWLHRGNIYSKNGELDNAIDCYIQGLKLVILRYYI